MANKRLQHLNQLRAAAMAGDRIAAAALARELFVPHHLRRAIKGGRIRSGYSGDTGNRYAARQFKPGLHVTAKTLQGVKSVDSFTIPNDYGLDRLQMLKDRRERRELRAAA